MQQPIETTSALADLGAASPFLPAAISRIQNNVFTYQRSKAAKFLHLVPILHFTAYTLPRAAPTTPPTSYTHHVNFSSFELKINIILLKTFQFCITWDFSTKQN